MLKTIIYGIAIRRKERTHQEGKKREMIGIIGAMKEEVTALREEIQNPQVSVIAGMEFCRGTLDGTDVVIVQCGFGKVNAGICAHTLISIFGCTKIINTGVAGSLDERIDIGDIVVSTDAVQHDFTVEALGFRKGEIPYTGLYAFPADETMRRLPMRRLPKPTYMREGFAPETSLLLRRSRRKGLSLISAAYAAKWRAPQSPRPVT